MRHDSKIIDGKFKVADIYDEYSWIINELLKITIFVIIQNVKTLVQIIIA